MTDNQYYRIPAIIMQDNNLTYFSRLLYGVILSLSSRKKHCFSHNQYFADVLCCSVQYVSKALQELKKNKYIEISYKRENEKIIQRTITPLVIIRRSPL